MGLSGSKAGELIDEAGFACRRMQLPQRIMRMISEPFRAAAAVSVGWKLRVGWITRLSAP